MPSATDEQTPHQTILRAEKSLNRVTRRIGKAGAVMASTERSHRMDGRELSRSKPVDDRLIGIALCLDTDETGSLPHLHPAQVSVTFAYPGASPEEVEQGIILAVEEATVGWTM